MSRPIVVYPLPPQLPTHPYLDLLYGPLVGDPTLQLWRGRPRYALPRLALGGGRRLLHLHFFDELTQRPAARQTAQRSLIFLAGLAALRLRGVRLVWTAHNLAPHELHHPAWGLLLYRCVARLSAATVAHSASALAQIAERYGPLRHSAVVPHGSFVGVYGPRRDQARSRAALGLPATGRLLLSVGALRPYKGLEGLLEAFGGLPAAERGTLLIAGGAKDAAYAARLTRQAAGIAGARVEARYVPDDRLALYLAAADLVVVPYQALLTSSVLLLGMSYGRAVVAPGFGPVRELVTEGREGFLFAPGDAAELGAALARGLAHPDLAAVGAAALATAQRFDWAESAARLADVYRAVA